jgi:2-keto-4-pentenoate hydratase/2-oxohepta-3-ene-1,7-dioic acid hydratase in catechol pathway
LIADLDRLRPHILAAVEGAVSFPVDGVKFLSPVAAPTKIVGTPTNYRDHVAEADQQREGSAGAIPARSRSRACFSRQSAR